MTTYGQLMLLILPVFAMIAIGVGLRALGWLTDEADTSLLKLVVNCVYPALIFENVYRNTALRVPANLAFAPSLGFVSIASSIGIALGVAHLLRLKKGDGRRTFGLSAGINNYGYIPIPLMAALFGSESLGVLLVYNVGCEVAVWTVGVLVLSGASLRQGWGKIFNGPVIALCLALVANLTGAGEKMPEIGLAVIHQCGVCAVPLGLILIGANIESYLRQPKQLFDARVTFGSIFLRLGLFPLGFLLVAKFLPCSLELKRVLVIESAMPAGIMPVVIAKHYGGHPLTAVRIVLGTTAVGIFSIPLWLRLGMAWAL